MMKSLSPASLALAMALTACADPSSEDIKLSSDVQRAIDANPALQADLLRVQASNRVVYLNGVVDTWIEYYAAETAARSVPGVAQIINKLEVDNHYG
jgi:osmotically-inducible protein OsmY